MSTLGLPSPIALAILCGRIKVGCLRASWHFWPNRTSGFQARTAPAIPDRVRPGSRQMDYMALALTLLQSPSRGRLGLMPRKSTMTLTGDNHMWTTMQSV